MRVRNAAIIAQRWGLDIVTVLAETDDVLSAVRVAGHVILNRLEEQARDQARRA